MNFMNFLRYNFQIDFNYIEYYQNSLSNLLHQGVIYRPISSTVYKIYFALLACSVVGIIGSILPIIYPLRTDVCVINLIAALYWCYSINEVNQIHHLSALMACAFVSGALLSSVILSLPFIDDQRFAPFFFGGASLVFISHILALRTHNIPLVFKFNLFSLPLMTTSLVTLFYLFDHMVHPIFYILVAAAAYLLWLVSMWYFKEETWIWGKWIPIHFLCLSLLSILTRYNLFMLMGLYFLMFGSMLHLNLHTFDVIHAAHMCCETHFLPIPQSIMLFTLFLFRLTFIIIVLGRMLFRFIWQATRPSLVCKWQAFHSFCSKPWNLVLLPCWDYSMPIIQGMWETICAYAVAFKDSVLRLLYVLISSFLVALLAFLLHKSGR